jgi:hypothetical protein
MKPSNRVFWGIAKDLFRYFTGMERIKLKKNVDGV